MAVMSRWYRGFAALGAVALLMAACAGPTLAPGAPGLARPSPTATTENRVLQQARLFMHELVAGNPSSQWELLSPHAQQRWPSATARAAMLTTKFRPGDVKSYALGAPDYPATWVSREDLRAHSGLWRVPVDLVLNPKLDEPYGVASDYLNLALYLTDPNAGKSEILGEGPASLDAPLIVPIHRTTRASQVPILMYHRVAPYPDRRHFPSRYDYQLEYGLTVDPAEFATQMEYLAGNGFTAISLMRLVDYLLYGLPLPPKPVVVTFDDGRESVMQYAIPVLQRWHFTAVLAVPTGLMGWRNETQSYLSANEVKMLASEGFWFEDHTSKDDVPLWSLPEPQLRALASKTRSQLRDLTGDPVQFIAYTGLWPYPDAATSGPTEQQLFGELGTMGYAGGLLDAHEDSAVESSQRLWQLPRIRVNPNEDLGTFASLL